jgi:hypothetical protein
MFFGFNKPDTQWDKRLARFSQGLLARGIVAGKHDFFRNWVRKFVGFIKPKRWNQVLREDVEQFLNLLLRESKVGCPQDSKALDFFFREVAPMD